MLSYALAIAVATSSLVLFLTAFLMSDIHRKDDFLWSGVGLIYALVLWYCARNITGAVLLGQAAATALLVSYSWQTLKLRRAIANPDKAAEVNNFSVLQKINGLLKRNKPPVKPAAPSVDTTVTPKVTEQEIAIPDTPVKDTVQKPAPVAVPPKKEVSVVDPVIEKPAIEDKAVESDSEPKLTEARESSNEEKDNRAFNAEPTSQPTEAGTSTQDTEIVPQLVEPEVVIQNKPQDNTVTAKNIKATPASPSEPEAKTQEPKVAVQNKRQDDTVTVKNIEATPALPRKPEAKKESADISTGDRQKVKTSDTGAQPESETTPEVESVEVEPVAEASPLDSLETVEVAEVLEAEEETINLDTDRSNIIEVTTTEINITTEITTLEQKPEEDSDFQEK